MPTLKQQAQAYLTATLGVAARLKAAPRLKLPFHIKDAYAFSGLNLELVQRSPVSVLFLLPVDDQYPGAVALKKHLSQVRNVTEDVVVYVSQTLTAGERRSLVAQRINFLQPGQQMFIPELAMDLREHLRPPRQRLEVSTLLPAAQALLLRCLYQGWQPGELFTANALKGPLPYSRVTLTKVIAQLLELNLLAPGERQGNANTYRFSGDTVATFAHARPYLRSPIRRRLAIDRTLTPRGGITLAGETALAAYTDLAEPRQPIYAMTRTMLDALPETAFKATDEIDEIKAWIEIWAYPSLNEADLADEASLLLSLEGNPDERIQIALQTIKEKITWLSADSTFFAHHFNAYQQQYVMIGGVASWLTMEQAGASFRATKDLDIVLVIEALSSEFVAHFWDFIKAGNYQITQSSSGKPVLYRFQRPTNADYPAQIELFSRAPEGIEHPEHCNLTPLPTDDSVSSLSAILLDDTYYEFLLEGRQVSLGITHIEADRLIPFKARAWLDLTARKRAGEQVDSKSIRKHRNDVLLLSGLLLDEPIALPAAIATDLAEFVKQLATQDINVKELGLRGALADVVQRLRLGFGL